MRTGLCLLTCLLAGSLLAPARSRADEDPAEADARVRQAGASHWAYRPLTRPRPPLARNAAWVRNPIDAFVLSRLEREGWAPSPEAPPHALIRRVTLDLAGIVPTPEELRAFLDDGSPARWESTVDRLLGSPAYGERWARHWLDVARYADTNGYERDGDKPESWRYRDWVIRALNADKPYDRFVREQLAGDELPDAGSESVIATGFLRLGPWDDEPADPKVDRHDQLDDVLATTAEAFLGQTLACARCHHHKFEPFTLFDYYRVQAIFAPLRRPQSGRAELTRPALPPGSRASAEAREQLLGALRRGDRAGALAGLAGGLALRGRADALAAEVARVPRAYVWEESAAPVTHVLRRGRPELPGQMVEPGLPAVLGARTLEFPRPGPHTSGRRLALANWIASPDNPLTARVIVNRVWQHHFGHGLVRTPSDFGTRGERPDHPELLDWMAGWFIEQGWSLKGLHRLILTSSTYRMARVAREECTTRDPETRALWRVPYRRLDAEAIRDSILAVSGQLDRTMYGRGVRPPMPRAALEGHSDPATVWPGDRAAAGRRTVYVHVKRSLIVPLVEALDFCDTTRGTPARQTTTVAPQALMLFNGELLAGAARSLADMPPPGGSRDPGDWIEYVFLRALSRPPTAGERERLGAYLARHADGRAAREQVARVVLNLNEFVYPD